MAICWSLALADRINLLKAETENANRSLTESEHRLSQILEGLPLGCCAVWEGPEAQVCQPPDL